MNSSNLDQLRNRESEYIQTFGEPLEVNHQLNPVVPHIDVYVFAPREPYDFYTLVTGGMSDRPMQTPSADTPRRCELVLYVEEPKPIYIKLLRYLASIPSEQDTWFSAGSTMTNGQPPQPIFEDSMLDCYVFLVPQLEGHNDLHTRLTIGDEGVFPLWVVPITQAECELIRDKGMQHFGIALSKNEHSLVLDESRQCYVSGPDALPVEEFWQAMQSVELCDEVGKPVEDPSLIRVDSWKEAFEYLNDPGWQRFPAERAREFWDLIAEIRGPDAVPEYRDEIKSTEREAYERIGQIVAAKADEIDCSEEQREHIVEWFQTCLRLGYRDLKYHYLTESIFFLMASGTIFSGHLPCGYEGEWPYGQLVVY